LPKITVAENERWILDQTGFMAPKGFSTGDSFKELRDLIKKPETPRPKEERGTSGLRVEYDDESLNDMASRFSMGERVVHQTYRFGSVVSISGMGRMTRVKVRFDEDREIRTIMATHLSRPT
jgi:hypothetical protein